MSFHKSSVIALALLVMPRLASAQTNSAVAPARHSVGIAAGYANPLGEFGNHVARGFAVDGAATYGFDSRGIFSLRGELGYTLYGWQSSATNSESSRGSVVLDSDIRSNVFTMGIGPQLSAPAGPVRPYVAGTIGFARFATESMVMSRGSASSLLGPNPYYDRTLSSDNVLSLGATAGVAFRTRLLRRSGVMDLGVRYYRNGRARYVAPGDVSYGGTETATLRTTESAVDFMVFRLGVVFPIRRSSTPPFESGPQL